MFSCVNTTSGCHIFCGIATGQSRRIWAVLSPHQNEELLCQPCPSPSTRAKVAAALQFVIPTGADPDFRYAALTSSHVCGFQ
jgi:hypothetical protein